MGLPLEATEFENEDDATYSGPDLLAAGIFHCALTEVVDKFDEEEKISLTFTALAGDTPGQEEKSRRCFLDFAQDQNSKDPEWKNEKSTQQAQQLAVVLGLKTLKEQKVIDFNDAIGRECIVEFVAGNKKDANGNLYVNYSRCWSLDNPAVASVPRGEVGEAVPFDDVVVPGLVVAPPPVTDGGGDDEFGDL